MKPNICLMMLLCMLLVTSSRGDPIFKELMTIDCQGNIRVMQSGFPVTFSFPLRRIWDYSVNLIRNVINCKCAIPSQLSELEFARRFVPGVSAGLNIISGSNKAVSNLDTCPLNLFSHTANDIDSLLINLPSTCTLASWEAGNPCYVQYNMPRYNMTLQLAADHCPGTYMPFLSATCSGPGCSNFAKPCASDNDCGQLGCFTLRGNSLNEFAQNIFSSLQDMFIYDAQDVFPGCYSTSSVQDYIMKYVLSYFTSTIPSSSFSDMQLCGIGFNNTDFLGDDFTNCMVNETSQSNPCDIMSLVVNITCPNIMPWNGVLSDMSSAVSSTRKSGSAFASSNALPSGTSTSNQVVLLQSDCNGNFELLPSEILGMGFSFGSFYQSMFTAFSTFLYNTQQCRFSPPVSGNAFKDLWNIWDIDYWSYLYTSNSQGQITQRSSFQSIFNVSSTLLEMPASCNLATYQSTGQCALLFTGFQNLLNVNVTLRIRAKRCSSGVAPAMIVDCDGTDCVNIVRPTFCVQQSDCPGDLVCKNVTEYLDTGLANNPIGLLLWGKSNNATCPDSGLDYVPSSETCYTSDISYFQMIHDAILNFTGRVPDGGSSTKMCFFDYDAVSANYDTWAKNMIINDGANFKLLGLNSWTNADFSPFNNNISTTTGTGLSSTGSSGSSSSGVGPSSTGSSGHTNSSSRTAVGGLALAALALLALLL